jgi:cytochrome c553
MALAGQAKSQTCTACHGADGNSTVPNWPKLAGQWEDYLVKQLIDYRHGQTGPRFEPSMAAMAAPLSDQDIRELSAFYAAQKPTTGKTDPALLTLGEKIYRGGDLEHGVMACAACHAPDGTGNQAAKFPRLGGQHALYIENQLRAFREGKRTNSPSDMMHDISIRMTDEQIKAVSSYIEGLH